jgi:hypothetical protein
MTVFIRPRWPCDAATWRAFIPSCGEEAEMAAAERD